MLSSFHFSGLWTTAGCCAGLLGGQKSHYYSSFRSFTPVAHLSSHFQHGFPVRLLLPHLMGRVCYVTVRWEKSGKEEQAKSGCYSNIIFLCNCFPHQDLLPENLEDTKKFEETTASLNQLYFHHPEESSVIILVCFLYTAMPIQIILYISKYSAFFFH